jgi:hypothetical protein
MPKPKADNADCTDWTRVGALTEDEIERMAAEDEDNPGTEEADWAEATIGLPCGRLVQVAWPGLSDAHERRPAALHGDAKEDGGVKPIRR